MTRGNESVKSLIHIYAYRSLCYKALIIHLSYTPVSPVCHCERQKVKDLSNCARVVPQNTY